MGLAGFIPFLGAIANRKNRTKVRPVREGGASGDSLASSIESLCRMAQLPYPRQESDRIAMTERLMTAVRAEGGDARKGYSRLMREILG